MLPWARSGSRRRRPRYRRPASSGAGRGAGGVLAAQLAAICISGAAVSGEACVSLGVLENPARQHSSEPSETQSVADFTQGETFTLLGVIASGLVMLFIAERKGSPYFRLPRAKDGDD